MPSLSFSWRSPEYLQLMELSYIADRTSSRGCRRFRRVCAPIFAIALRQRVWLSPSELARVGCAQDVFVLILTRSV